MILKDILYKVSIRSVKGNTNIEVKDLQIDSRKVTAGSCFIALKGSAADGHLFIDTAIEKGAVAVICEVRSSGAIAFVEWKPQEVRWSNSIPAVPPSWGPKTL